MSNRLSISGSIAGINFRGAWQSDGENVAGAQLSIAAAKTGTLSTRTDNDTGTLTMSSGHGITTGATFDLYWVSGGVTYHQHTVTAGTVSGNSVPFDLGTGTNLPVQGTAIFAMVQNVIPCEIPDVSDLNNDALLVVQSDIGGLLIFRTADDLSGTETVVDLVADEPFICFAAVQGSNALGIALGGIESMTFTHPDSTAAATLKWGVAFAS